jgi:hypothetical protein
VRLGPIGPTLVGLGVALQVGALVGQTHDQQRRVEQVAPRERFAIARADRVPVALRLGLAFEDQEGPALAETG